MNYQLFTNIYIFHPKYDSMKEIKWKFKMLSVIHIFRLILLSFKRKIMRWQTCWSFMTGKQTYFWLTAEGSFYTNAMMSKKPFTKQTRNQFQLNLRETLWVKCSATEYVNKQSLLLNQKMCMLYKNSFWDIWIS